MAYQVPKVSKYFLFDWNFALKASRIPLLRPASVIIALMPLITEAAGGLFGMQFVKIPLSAWISWCFAVSFIISWLILKLACPNIIQHYRHYGDYAEHKHSHRWIVWLFHAMTGELDDWQSPVKELHEKGISINLRSAMCAEECRLCPAAFPSPANTAVVKVFEPIVEGRDIYMPIHCVGERRVLVMQESDPKLMEKEKELFWIIFAHAAKERLCARVAFWVFFGIALALLGFNVLRNIYLVICP